MSVYKHLFCRNGHYYFRSKIPTDLLCYFPSNEIKKSLKTSDFKSALAVAASIRYKVQKAFTLLRSGMLQEEQVAGLIHGLVARKSLEDKQPTTLSIIMQQYINELGKNWGTKTTLEMQGTYRLILDVVGDIKLNNITKHSIVDLRGTLAQLPANMYKIYPDLTIKQILNRQDVIPMSTTSVNKHVSRLSSLMKYAIKEGYISINYAENMKIRQKRRMDEERKAYNAEDIQRIVTSLPHEAERSERFWIPLLAMYSGMRLDEICQLYLEDIQEIEGIWCFNINDEKDKKLKTLSSKRIIPVHPTLLSLGFINHVEAIKKSGLPRLWMNLKRRDADGYSNAFGKWFQRFNRANVTMDNDKVFHSFRHTVADHLKQKNVSDTVIAEILGHAHDSITMGRYGKRYQPQVLLDALMKLDYGLLIPESQI
jgi:integrase